MKTPETRCLALQLIAITADGEPATPVGGIPEIAAEVMAATADMYRSSGFEPPWIGYLAVEERRIVGTCAFKCAPVDDRVEIAYFTFPEFEGRGIATSMATALIALARATCPGLVVTAQTRPQRNVSNAILGKLGFTFAGSVMHPEDGEIWEWHLGRSNDATQETPG
jgi:RimJ/RimL family protein N-acetyltransferase